MICIIGSKATTILPDWVDLAECVFIPSPEREGINPYLGNTGVQFLQTELKPAGR